jgi:hypothetical protein
MLISPLVNFVGELKWVVLSGGQKTISSFVFRHNQPQRQLYLIKLLFSCIINKMFLIGICAIGTIYKKITWNTVVKFPHRI